MRRTILTILCLGIFSCGTFVNDGKISFDSQIPSIVKARRNTTFYIKVKNGTPENINLVSICTFETDAGMPRTVRVETFVAKNSIGMIAIPYIVGENEGALNISCRHYEKNRTALVGAEAYCEREVRYIPIVFKEWIGLRKGYLYRPGGITNFLMEECEK